MNNRNFDARAAASQNGTLVGIPCRQFDDVLGEVFSFAAVTRTYIFNQILCSTAQIISDSSPRHIRP